MLIGGGTLKALSVIVPIYNAEKYLEECLDSLVKQSLKEIEVLLINDGSTDKSREIAEEYVEKYGGKFRLINKENGGVASARNRGLELATGEYIAFLDPDDYVLPNTYRVMYLKSRNTKSDTFIGNIKCFNEERTWGLPYMAKLFEEDLPEVRHIKNNPELNLSPSVCNKLFKRNLILKYKLKFDEEINVGEDFLFTQQCLYLSNRTCVLNINSLNYRVIQSESSLTKRSDVIYFKHLYKNIQKLKEFYVSHNLEKYSITAEKRQWKFFIDSIIVRQKTLDYQELEEVFEIGFRFYKMLLNDFTMDELLGEFNHYELLGHQFLKGYEKKKMFQLLEIIKNPKKFRRSNVITVQAEVYSFLYEYFPEYSDYLRVKNVNFKKLKSVLKLEVFKMRNGILTIGGYIFYYNYASEKNDKKRLVFRNLETKSEISVDLDNELRTDITNLNGSGVQNYDYCGFKQKDIDLRNLDLENGHWEIRIIVEKNQDKKLSLEHRIQNKTINNKNYAKRNFINEKQIDTLLNRTYLTIKVSKVSGLRHFKNQLIIYKLNLKQEMKLLRKRMYKSLLIIWLYRLISFYFKKQDIWFIGERSDTAQDNSYHLFKYIREKHPDIKCYYVIDRKSPDFDKIKDYGNIVYFNSIRHTFLLLVASKIINSYSDKVFMHTEEYKQIIGIYPEWREYGKNIFLQHGVIGVSRVNHVLHKNKTNYDLFIVSSKGEKRHIVKEYGYPESEVKLTGLARWDNLGKISEKKEILIMPTWRAWIKNEESLLKSDYFQRLNSLIHNEELIKLIEENDLIINFYLHYEAQRLLENLGVQFESTSKNIKVIKKDSISVQQLLKSSSLLITDYSTVSFDFAYMYKPVIFYQFDYELFFSQHYREGIINHQTDLFGKVIKDEDLLVSKIQYYVDNKMKMETKYKEKTKRFVMKPKRGTHCAIIFEEIRSIDKGEAI
ncbi:hypothetical protein TU50_17680 [Bacillus wiedmannii]|nr:hypothetical protein TU50_17680 [Bacillus wiedmannii]